MWSISYKTVSVTVDTQKTKCKVCKEENCKDIVTEKKRLTILYVIPISLVTERVEICPACNVRMKVKESGDLIDSKI
jgi:hypothetical protein